MKRRPLFSYLCFVLAVGITAAGILGPLALGVIEFHLPDTLVNQYVGGEVATLFIAAPMLVAAGVLGARKDRLAPVLAFGPALYAVYTFVTAVVGQEYLMYDGNGERAFPLYAAIIASGLMLAGMAGWEIAHQPSPGLPDGLRRVTAGIFLAVVVFFALSWSSQIAQVYRGETPAEYVEGPTLFWLVKLMDLGFLLPVFAVIGIGVARRHELVTRIAYGLVSYAVCMTAAVLGMAIAMWLRDDPSASVAMILFLAPVTIGLAFVAVQVMALYRTGGSREREASMMDTSPPLGHGHAG